MRIAIGGLMHESNTFASSRTTSAAFRAGSLTRGAKLVETWRDAHHEVGGFLGGARSHGFEAIPTTMAWATPSGPVADDVLDTVVAEIAEICQRPDVDGLLLALHGAMVSEQHLDADGEILRRLRAALGPDRPLVATLDYHANVSDGMASHASALLAYQTYPHVDQRQTGLRAAALISRTLSGDVVPTMALAKPPLLINILAQDTESSPMRMLMNQARALEQQDGVLAVSLLAGFPYADVPEIGPGVLVVTDGDPGRAWREADQLSGAMWNLRHELQAHRPDATEAVSLAFASARTPVVLVDLGDNIGGGTPGDGTLLLRELIARDARDTLVVLHDPAAAEAAHRMAEGAEFSARVGGRSEADLYGPPVEVRGRVHRLHDGNWVEHEPRHGGLRQNDQGKTAVIELPGPIWLVLNSLRTPPFSLGQITSLGLDPASLKIVVVKAAVAYKAAYLPIAGSVIEVDTPGLTALDLNRFRYRQRNRKLFPLDQEATT